MIFEASRERERERERESYCYFIRVREGKDVKYFVPLLLSKYGVL